MTLPTPINTLQYLKPEHIRESQKLQAGYYRDVIYQYGIPIKYFKSNTTYLKTFRPEREDYIRGENPHLEYATSADLMAYVQVDNSIVQLTSLGLQTNDNFKVSFLINEFDYAFSQYLGEDTEISSIRQTEVFQVSAGEVEISSEYIYTDMSGVISGVNGLSGLPSGESSGQIDALFYPYSEQLEIQPLLYLRNYYNAFKIHQSDFTIDYNADLDSSGNGTITADISGSISYNKYSDFEDFRKRIRPEVGDIIRIQVDDVFEDIQISQVMNRRPTTDGLNPLMKKYIWETECVRREVSHEDMIGDEQQEDSSIVDIIDENRETKEYLSDEEFDYNIEDIDSDDLKHSDRVYGGYGKLEL